MRDWSCEEVRTHWSEHLDGRCTLEVGAAIESHFASCDSCEQRWKRYRALFDAFREEPATALAGPKPRWPSQPPGYGHRARPAPRSAWHRFKPAAAAAAVLVLVLSHTAVYNAGQGEPEPDRQVMVRPFAEHQPEPSRSNSSRHEGFERSVSTTSFQAPTLRSLLRDHCDGTEVFLRVLALLPESSGQAGRALVEANLLAMEHSFSTADLQGAQAALAPAERAIVNLYLKSYRGFCEDTLNWLMSDGEASPEFLRRRAEEHRLMALAAHARAHFASEAPGGTWASLSACERNPTNMLKAECSPMVEGFLDAQESLLSGTHLAAARAFRGLRAQTRSERALLPVAKVLEAECLRRAGLHAESRVVLGQSGSWTIGQRSAALPMLARDPLFGPHMRRVGIPTGTTRSHLAEPLSPMSAELVAESYQSDGSDPASNRHAVAPAVSFRLRVGP